jgi:hypothetical protein
VLVLVLVRQPVLLLLAVVLPRHRLANHRQNHSPASHPQLALLPVWRLVGWRQLDLLGLLLSHQQKQVAAAPAAVAPAAGQALLC